MKAIIEISNDMIRNAGAAIGFSRPSIIDDVITAVERLTQTDELVLRFDSDADRKAVEENSALLAITQTMEDLQEEKKGNQR